MTNQTTLPQLPPALQQDPAWYATRRSEALRNFVSLSIPGRDNEEWRRTDTRFDPSAYSMYTAAGESLPAEIAELVATGPAIVQHNSEIVLERLPEELANQGVIFCSMQTALEKHAELVERYLFTRCFEAAEHKLAAQHVAFLSGGAFLYVPPNVEINEMLQIFTWGDADKVGIFNHVLVVADKFSKVAVTEWLGSPDGVDLFQNGAVEIYAEDGAKVEYTALQTLGDAARSLNPRKAKVGRDASVVWYTGDLGGAKSRADQISFMDADGGHSEAFLLFFSSGDQHMDIGSNMLHTTGRNAHSNIVARGVLTDTSHIVYRGGGHVNDGAKGCTTYQSEKALLLTDDAHHDTIPGLFIHDSEVAGAGHAATVGQLDEAQIFYLMTRGLTRAQASRMIVRGFIGPVVDHITSDAVRAQVERLVDRKLGVN